MIPSSLPSRSRSPPRLPHLGHAQEHVLGIEDAQHEPAPAVEKSERAQAERQVTLFDSPKAGELPPNNWKSVFGGPAWTRVTEVASAMFDAVRSLEDEEATEMAEEEIRAETVSHIPHFLDEGWTWRR